MRSKRHLFTLFEILIVLGLIALIAGVVAININKALIDQRFRNEVSYVVETLRLAQDLMLILNADVYVKFREEPSNAGIFVFVETETRLPNALQKELKRKHHLLKSIKGVFFTDELENQFIKGKADVKFLSNGAVMSKGIMRLATSSIENPPSNVLENYICLAGYPRPIFSRDNETSAEKDCDDRKDENFDRQLTLDTFGRLPEKLKQADDEPSPTPSMPEETQNPPKSPPTQK